jgi:hypothetical protein
MPLREEFEKTGNWLFRWRSYLPLLLVGIVLIGLRHYHYPDHSEEMDDIWEIICNSRTPWKVALGQGVQLKFS